MAPTKRKKSEKQPQQPKRPSVAKKGRAAAPASDEPKSMASAGGLATGSVSAGRAGKSSEKTPRGFLGRLQKGRRAKNASQDASAMLAADHGGEESAPADDSLSAFEEFATVDLADGALYSGSELSTEDIFQQEDRVGEDPLADRETRHAGEATASGGAADNLLPRNAVSAVMGADAMGDLRPASYGDKVADAAAGSTGKDFGGSAASGGSGAGKGNDDTGQADGAGARADNGVAGNAPVSAEGVSSGASAAAGPAEITDEERAAFYSAVPQQRPEKPEGKGSRRPKRKGKVAAAKAGVGKRGNPRAEVVGAGGEAKGSAAASTARGASRVKKTAPPRKVSVGFVVKVVIVAVLVLAVALAVAAVVAFNQVRNGGDDAQDFQGTWYLNGTNVPVEVTADEIVLTSDVAYGYQLDAADKTIELKFGNLKGGGSYLFSLNRQQLMIVDGKTSGEELLPDFFWTIQALLAQVRGDDEYPLPQMENATYLNRAPAPGRAVTDASAAGNGLLANGEGASDSGGGDSAGNASGSADGASSGGGGSSDGANSSSVSGDGTSGTADSGAGDSGDGE